MKKLLLLALCLCAPAYADEATNVAAHIFASSIMTTSVYAGLSVFTGQAQENKLPALLAATTFSIAMGTAFELMDANGGRLDGVDMGVNVGSALLTAGVIYFLDIHGVKPAPGGVAFEF